MFTPCKQQALNFGAVGFCQKQFASDKSLIMFPGETTRGMDKGNEIEVCYLDFIKAFDFASQFLLDLKLPAFGITGEAGDHCLSATVALHFMYLKALCMNSFCSFYL